LLLQTRLWTLLMRKHQVLSWFIEAQTEKRGDKVFTLSFSEWLHRLLRLRFKISANFLKKNLVMRP